MFKNNVIDLNKRRELKDKDTATKSQQVKTKQKAPIVDMTKRREEILNEERREVRRTILTGFIGAFVVVPQPVGSKSKGGLLKVEIYDISAEGISFDVDPEYGQFKKGEEFAMRVYLSHNAYFPFSINVQNIRRLEGDGAYRHGASFARGTVNDEALHHFVKFIETVSASLERDTGDIMVSNLKK
jgi:PilZ domain